MAQVMDSSFPVQTQSSGQNMGFDPNTLVEEEEEEQQPVHQILRIKYQFFIPKNANSDEFTC
jgi:hypothetical protein